MRAPGAVLLPAMVLLPELLPSVEVSGLQRSGLLTQSDSARLKATQLRFESPRADSKRGLSRFESHFESTG